MINLTLSVPEVHCDHCVMSIESAVGALPGVDTVAVHLDPKTVDVAFDDQAVSLDAIIETISEQGYEVVR
ncbi:MAG TPA: copper ion binding protein [Acidimicrobiia bacterium]|nr:copper ion binding protein [Acidimicrobiia bacterium]